MSNLQGAMCNGRPMKDSGVEWIGEIPQEWDVRATKASFDIVSGATPKSDNPDYWDGNIIWITPADYKFEDKYIFAGKRNISQKGYESCGTSLVPVHSVVFSKRAPIGTVALAGVELCTNQGCLSCVPRNDVSSKYYYYTMSVFSDQYNLLGTGTTFKEISFTAFSDFRLPFPPYLDQCKIADFLDRKCAEIDRVIADTQRTIEEYKALKQSIITEAVTKGVRGPRPMKDSGVAWIGEIPEEWEVRRIKTLFDLRDEKNYLPLEEVNLISLYTDLGVVQHADLEKTTGNKASNADGYKKVYENDIIVNIILCWMGAIGRSSFTGVTSPAYDIYVPKLDVDSRFYHYYFRTIGFSGDCFKRGRGIMAMRWRTYSEQFMDIKVVYPPIVEQHEILDYLYNKCGEIDRLIKSKQQLSSELETYKKSVIFEYVTGKKEVK